MQSRKKVTNYDLFYGLGPSLTDEQRHLLDAMFDPSIKVVVINSPAGTGKTTLVVGAAKLLAASLIYIFPNVCEKELGYLPGPLWDKYYQYLAPLFDALEEIGEDPAKVVFNEDADKDPIIRSKQMQNLKNGSIWVQPSPHVFLRGRNLKGNKVICIDEAQNYSKKEIKKIITRVHDDVHKVVLAGHMGQCDLDPGVRSGFPDYIDFYRKVPYARVIDLTKCFRGVIASDADRV